MTLPRRSQLEMMAKQNERKNSEHLIGINDQTLSEQNNDYPNKLSEYNDYELDLTAFLTLSPNCQCGASQ